MKDQEPYILGTDEEELKRLQTQHNVWRSETIKGWSLAEFKLGDVILDLGSGPGYCTKELAEIVGPSGKVIGVDRSQSFINHLNKEKHKSNLNIEPILSTFDDLELDSDSLDGIYCRWALAWIPNPKEILNKLKHFLKPGGKMVIHEYYFWTSHRTQPEKPALKKAIGIALKSFKDSDSEIDVGKYLHGWFHELGMGIVNHRLMPKLATPNTEIWEWPKTFYKSYFPRLIEMGLLTNEDVNLAFEELKSLETLEYATLWCPLMIEVIAAK